MEKIPAEIMSSQDVGKLAERTPTAVNPEFPYLIEKATGIVHPYTAGMAKRGDLVMGCYNRFGSRDPADIEERPVFKRQLPKRNYLNDAPADTVADIKAKQYAALKQQALEEIKNEERAKLSTDVETSKKAAKKKEEVAPDVVVGSEQPNAIDTLKVQINNM